MTTILTYAELTVGVIGFCLMILIFLNSISLLMKTIGRLKKIAVYFLLGSIAGTGYIAGRMISLEVLLPAGKLIGLIFMLIVFVLVFLIILELNKIINEILYSKWPNKYKNKLEKKEIKIKNIPIVKEEKTTRKKFAENISNKYLDLTGRKPKFRE